jgi:hypothetical protein
MALSGCTAATPSEQPSSSPVYDYVQLGNSGVLVAQGAKLPSWFPEVVGTAWSAAAEHIDGTPLSAGRLGMVVEVPADYEAFQQVMGVDDDGLRGQAALTWVTDTPLPNESLDATAPRVVVNPLWTDTLRDVDREAALLVLTHEAVHVATGVRPSAAGRLWVAEGVAEYVALSGDTTALAASESLVVPLCSDPLQLPSDEGFRSSEVAYDLSALLVKLVVEQAGFDPLKLWWDGGGTPETTLSELFSDWCDAQS